MKLYHGTTQIFEKFDTSAEAANTKVEGMDCTFFSPVYDVAEDYAYNAEWNVGGKPVVYECEISDDLVIQQLDYSQLDVDETGYFPVDRYQIDELIKRQLLDVEAVHLFDTELNAAEMSLDDVDGDMSEIAIRTSALRHVRIVERHEYV